ncbi:MAG: YkgJ family cysteine cluster protein [Deltaproteobacteria bacterium]|nr:YkgJ family cysteine cluster protein [Deltaproteobacteria bacterium]
MAFGPKRSALEALWTETTRRPLWLPPNLLRYVRLSRRVNLVPLRRRDVRVEGPRFGVSKCNACTNNCCVGKKNTVSLRLVDIATLIDLGRADLIRREKPRFSEADKLSSKARARFLASDAFTVFPVLRQDEHDRCAALSDGNRCTLHPHWPLSCARFPYALDLDAREVFYSPRCPSYDIVDAVSEPRVKTMIDATLAAYNERIRDFVLLDHARAGLERIGLTEWLNL